MSFFSHRETRIASEVTLAMYFVFFWSSSDTGLVVADTTADAEFEFVFEFGCTLDTVLDVPLCRFDLLIVTVVQSWQSGGCLSGVLYLFFIDIVDGNNVIM